MPTCFVPWKPNAGRPGAAGSGSKADAVRCRLHPFVETVEKGFVARARCSRRAVVAWSSVGLSLPGRGGLHRSQSPQGFLGPSLLLLSSQPLSRWALWACRHPIRDALGDMMDAAVAPPLARACALAPSWQTLSALGRPSLTKAWCHHGAPPASARAGGGRVSLRDPLLGPGLMGWLHTDGQIFAARLGVL